MYLKLKVSIFLLYVIFYFLIFFSELCWKRVLLRSSVIVVILGIAEIIADFPTTMELAGGLLAAPYIFFFPPIFYVILKVCL